jgi:hypothetical protein
MSDKKYVMNFLITILVLGSFLIILYVIDSLINPPPHLAEIVQSEVQPEVQSEVQSEVQIETQPENMTEAETQMENQPISLPSQADILTKTFYQKFDDILLPSSKDPFISHKNVCFRGALESGIDKKYDMCMACMVDHRNNPNMNYDQTNTNIVLTCPYNSFGGRTKEQCVEICKKYDDLKDSAEYI